MFFKRKGHLNFQPQIFSTFFKKDLPGHFDFVFLCPPKTVNLYPPWPRRFCSDTPVVRPMKPAESLSILGVASSGRVGRSAAGRALDASAVDFAVSGLRLDPSVRNRQILAHGYEFLCKLHTGRQTPFYLSTMLFGPWRSRLLLEGALRL